MQHCRLYLAPSRAEWFATSAFVLFASIQALAPGKQSAINHLSQTIQANLTCYCCNTIGNNDSCPRLMNTNSSESKRMQRTCGAQEKYCTVVSLDYSMEGGDRLPWSLERNCSSECQDGCIVLGERTKLYLCHSCCRESLCNYGSGAAPGSPLTYNVTWKQLSPTTALALLLTRYLITS